MAAQVEGVEEQLARVGKRIRRWRAEAGLTLQELAGRSGVASGTIQKVETSGMVPTLAVLIKIARGLGRLPSELIREEAGDLEMVVQRAKDRPALGSSDRGRLERLSGDLFEPALEAWRVQLEPGNGMGRGTIRYEGEEFVFCEEGRVTFQVGDETVVLETGDSLHFKAILPHAWRNEGDVPARFIVTGTVPQALRRALHGRNA